ncbi:leucyl/phenylalanyl-tRNA--protein transferase [Kaarinaea lacus]
MSGLAPFWIDPRDTSYRFPDVSLALEEPNGLLAVGGCLSPERLGAAYCQGIFPWYNEDQPILWWSPNPRAVLFPQNLHVSKSLRKTLRKNLFTLTIDTAFNSVLQACAASRNGQNGTWITTEMQQAYNRMHQLGFAHSVEAWQNDQLVGGLYGLAFGKVFFGESMFSRVTNASKVAFVEFVHQLQQWDYKLIDCQVESEHLNSLGAQSIPREEFIQWLDKYCYVPNKATAWHFEAQCDDR